MKTKIEEVIRPFEMILNEKPLSLDEISLPCSLDDNERYRECIETLLNIKIFLKAISQGDLEHPVRGRGYMIGYIKNLQSILNHMVIQTRLMARGDFDVSIDYLGDLSQSFQYMNESLKELMEKLHHEKQRAVTASERFELLFNSTKNLVLIFAQKDQKILDVNQGFLDVSGLEKEQILGHSITDLNIWRNKEVIQNEINRLHGLSEEVASSEMELVYFEKGGSQRHGLLFIKKITLGGIESFLMDIRDITALKELEQKIIQISQTDKLTQLSNRTGIDEKLSDLIQMSKINRIRFSLLMIDIDFFKNVNDEYGHLEGDNILKELAGIISRVIRGKDLAGRWGGEEFLVALYGSDVGVGKIVAERLRQAVENRLFDKVGHITVSIGVTEYQEGESIAETVERVDRALYFAKNNGRNQVQSL